MAKNRHVPGLSEKLLAYAQKRLLDFNQYSPYHMRIMDGGYTVLDVWTTGRYYILTTDYIEWLEFRKIERGGEKGQIPTEQLTPFLDDIFFGQPVED